MSEGQQPTTQIDHSVDNEVSHPLNPNPNSETSVSSTAADPPAPAVGVVPAKDPELAPVSTRETEHDVTVPESEPPAKPLPAVGSLAQPEFASSDVIIGSTGSLVSDCPYVSNGVADEIHGDPLSETNLAKVDPASEATEYRLPLEIGAEIDTESIQGEGYLAAGEIMVPPAKEGGSVTESNAFDTDTDATKENKCIENNVSERKEIQSIASNEKDVREINAFDAETDASEDNKCIEDNESNLSEKKEPISNSSERKELQSNASDQKDVTESNACETETDASEDNKCIENKEINVSERKEPQSDASEEDAVESNAFEEKKAIENSERDILEEKHEKSKELVSSDDRAESYETVVPQQGVHESHAALVPEGYLVGNASTDNLVEGASANKLLSENSLKDSSTEDIKKAEPKPMQEELSSSQPLSSEEPTQELPFVETVSSQESVQEAEFTPSTEEFATVTTPSEANPASEEVATTAEELSNPVKEVCEANIQEPIIVEDHVLSAPSETLSGNPPSEESDVQEQDLVTRNKDFELNGIACATESINGDTNSEHQQNGVDGVDGIVDPEVPEKDCTEIGISDDQASAALSSKEYVPSVAEDSPALSKLSELDSSATTESPVVLEDIPSVTRPQEETTTAGFVPSEITEEDAPLKDTKENNVNGAHSLVNEDAKSELVEKEKDVFEVAQENVFHKGKKESELASDASVDVQQETSTDRYISLAHIMNDVAKEPTSQVIVSQGIHVPYDEACTEGLTQPENSLNGGSVQAAQTDGGGSIENSILIPEEVQYHVEQLTEPAPNTQTGFQCTESDTDVAREEELAKDENDTKLKEKSSYGIKIPLIFAGLAIATVGVAVASISRHR